MEALTCSGTDEQNDAFQTFPGQERSTSELVRRVLSQVQTEFTAWNIIHCHQVLASFAAPFTWKSCLHPNFRSPVLALTLSTSNLSPDARPASAVNSPLPLVFQEVYSPDGTVNKVLSVELDVINLSSSLEPHPPYESCSPLQRSVFKGDDSDNMDFIPYADDHTFDQTRYTYHYGSFSWQDTFDPDLEVIVLEAVYRLQVQYDLSYDEIEACNVLPLKLRSHPGITGVLSATRRRDRLNWAGNTIPASYTFPTPTRLEGSNFRNRLKTLNSFFCPNLNCVEPLCGIHVEPNLMPLKWRPLASHALGGAMNPCRNQCFVNTKAEEANPSWEEADFDIFNVILEMSPNIASCDLAELCLKPCYEVFYFREHSDKVQPVDIGNQRRIPRFDDNNPALFTPNDPCHHTGPCSSSSGCPCFKNRSHCQRNCHCLPECNRRWQGCHCARTRSKWSCMTNRCPCIEAFRECDPELCINCRCIADNTHCRNSQLQRGACKELEVRKSSWGLGTFLAEAAKTGDLISEYTGELIYEPTVESRGDLAAHRNRCYVFGLNSTFSLDSTYAGNISRFINHSDAVAEQSRQANSQAQVRMINGDHRIGIFAIRDVEAGSEVLIDYGSLFFVE